MACLCLPKALCSHRWSFLEMAGSGMCDAEIKAETLELTHQSDPSWLQMQLAIRMRSLSRVKGKKQLPLLLTTLCDSPMPCHPALGPAA